MKKLIPLLFLLFAIHADAFPVVSQQGSFITVRNDTSTGTTLNTLTVLNGNSPSQAVIAPANTSAVIFGITVAGAGKANAALIQTIGVTNCVFDGSTTAGDFVQISPTIDGNCHDGGSSPNVSSIGTVTTTNAGAGTYTVILTPSASSSKAPINLLPAQTGNYDGQGFDISDVTIGQVTPLAGTFTSLKATTLQTVTLFADQFSGVDWASQINSAIAACPASKICKIDARNLTPGTSSSSLNINQGGIRIELGQGTYAFSGTAQVLITKGAGSATLIDGVEVAGQGPGQTTLSFANSLHGFDITGTAAIPGAGFAITAATAVNDMTLTVNNADIVSSGITTGSRIFFGDVGTEPNAAGGVDFQRFQWDTVASASGTTITLTDPVRWILGTSMTAQWYPVTTNITNTKIHDLNIGGTTGGALFVGIYSYNNENTEIYNTTQTATNATNQYFVSSGRTWRENIHDNDWQGLKRVELDAMDAGNFWNNRIRCEPNGSTLNFLLVDQGTSYSTFSNNMFACGVGVLAQDTDFNTFQGNRILGNGTGGNAIGIYILGGNGHTIVDNTIQNVVDGVRVLTDAVTSNNFWTPSTVYAAHACVLSIPDNGWYFCTTAGGTSGATQPAGIITPVLNAATTDNTVTWLTTGKYHTAIKNLIANNHIRNATNGVNISRGGTSSIGPGQNIVSNLDVDATVTTPIIDSGAQTTFDYTNAGGQVVQRENNNFNGDNQYTTGKLIVRAYNTVATPAITKVNCSGATTFGYRVACKNASSGVLGGLSAEVTTTTACTPLQASTAACMTVTWTPSTECTSYNVYGRTAGAELLMNNVTIPRYDDCGQDTPSGGLPADSSGAFASTFASVTSANDRTLDISGGGHINSRGGTLPTVGTGTVTAGGTDNAMEVTGATSPATVTFATSFAVKPVCTCTDKTAVLGACKAVSTTGTVVVTTAATDSFDLICVGK